jgi:Protein of unknown function (DUF2934)
MDQTLTERIRERAYEIWAANGRPDGQAEQHWFTAEREFLYAQRTALAAQPAMVKKSSRTVRRASKQGSAKVF